MVLLVSAAPVALAVAQTSQEPMARGENLPRLGDIMLAKQWRHIKLWFAGKQKNWELATYELAQIKASLADAAMLYSNIPVNDVVTMAVPIQSISKAIEAKDIAGFTKGFNELTAGCNSCHRQMARAFIEIKVPTASPFSNQTFGTPTER